MSSLYLTSRYQELEHKRFVLSEPSFDQSEAEAPHFVFGRISIATFSETNPLHDKLSEVLLMKSDSDMSERRFFVDAP